jgi:tetratricopeptide (TPR) repeat protein
VVSDNADQVALLLSQAHALMQVRRYKDAEERARQAAALAPQDVDALCALSRAQCGLEQYADAARTAEEAIRVAPGEPSCFQLRAIALSRLASEHHGAGRTRFAYQAAESARESVRLAPSDPNGYLRVADALRMTQDYSEAQVAAQEAIRLAPNSPAVWVTASLVALSTKSWETAITACRKALSIDPSNYSAMNNLGVALRASGKKREGTKVLAEAARIDPDAPTARTNLTRAGLNVARIVVMVLLLPIGFIAHIGFGAYIVFAVLSNVLIEKYPDQVLRFERWATPLALFVSRRGSRDRSGDPTT